MNKLIAAAVVLAGLSAPAFADDIEDGAKVFNKCKSCHQVGEGAKNRTGPVLNGIVDAPAAAVEGFKYSDGLTAAAAAGLVWDAESLSAWLEDPTAFLKEKTGDSGARSKMTFKLKNEEEREHVIAYLGSL